MKGLSHILAILPLFLASFLSEAARSPFIQQYTAFDGLPSNVVYHIYQDSNRFIWMATDAGVAKFDGSHFTYFRTKDGLQSNMVIRMKEDSQQRIWFFYLDGSIGFYDNGAIYNTRNAPFLSQITGDEIVCDFIENESRSLYFYSFLDDTVFLLDSATQVKTIKVRDDRSIRPVARESAGTFIVKNMYKSADGRYFIWDRLGLFSANDLTEEFRIHYALEGVRNIFPAGENMVYADIPGQGIFLLGIQGGGEVNQIEFIPMEALSNSINISSVFMDSSRVTWVLTFDKGIFCFRHGTFVRHLDIRECQAIIEDHEKNIWVSTMSNGVHRINPMINSSFHIGFPSPGEPAVTALGRHHKKGVWLTNGQRMALMQDMRLYQVDYHTNGTFIHQMLHLDKNRLLVNKLNSEAVMLTGLHQDESRGVIRPDRSARSTVISKRYVLSRDQDELISYASGNLYIHSLNDLLSSHTHLRLGSRIQFAWYDANDILHLNTQWLYSFKNNELHVQNDLARFHNKIISGHVNINDSTELFVLEGDSIFLMQNRQLYFIPDFRQRGIDMRIMHEDHSGGMLFLATSGRVYVADSLTNVLSGKPLAVSGLTVEFRNIHDMLYEGDFLHIASDDGLTMIPLSGLNQAVADPPVPYFLSIEVNDSVWSSRTEAIRLRGSNKLKVNFGSINYSGSPVHFGYMLSGVDVDWSTQSGNQVVYQDLPRGRHQFMLRVKKPESGWSHPVAFMIEVRPEIWQHPLFYVVIVLLTAGLLYFFIVRRKYAEIKRKETEHQLIMLEQKALQSMMNPHFIFNALGSIQNYLLQNKAGDAGLYLSQFARLIRQNLSAIDSSFISLNEEIERLRNYVQLEQLRFAEKFCFQINLDESIDEEIIKIPSMMLQPVVENAIWHGVSGLDHNGCILITFSPLTSNSIKITVEDNGQGVNQSLFFKPSGENHLNISMSLMKKRLVILGRKMGVETSIHTEDAKPDSGQPGTRVTLIVPVVKES